MSKPTLIGSIALAALNEFPDVNTKTLARKLSKENPQVGNTDQFQASIRWYRGSRGSLSRTAQKAESHDNPAPPVPASDNITKEPYQIPKDRKNLLILSDIHFPYHDEKALQAAVVWAADHPIDTLILNGDIIDCYEVSRFMKDPRQRRLADEISGFIELMQYFDYHFPKCLKIWKQGNHESRWSRYLIANAPILWSVTAFDLPQLLQAAHGYDMNAQGWQWIGDKRIIKAGHLSIIHGHELPGNATVNIARGRFLRTYDNILAGHSHRKNDDVVKNIGGKFYGSYSIGCLCQLTPEYNPINQWTHGFAYVKMNDDGTFRAANLQIIDGRVM